MRTNRAIVLAVLLAVASGAGFSRSNSFWIHGGKKDESPHLTFVREISSPQDVKHEHHPVLDRSIDIIAGPKDPQPVVSVLQAPYGVTSDSMHRIFVTDIAARAVHVFDFANEKYSLLHGGAKLRFPFGVAADREGNVYVSDRGLQTILVYDSQGRFAHYLKKLRGKESYFDDPYGIAIDPATEHMYVCDRSRHFVVVLDKGGHVLARFGKRFGGDGPGEFSLPTQIAVAGGEIVVLDSGNRRIQILDEQGHFQREIRVEGISNGSGLAIDSDKNIYVTDPPLDRLQAFSLYGQELYEFGQTGTQPGQFRGISGIWLNSGHCLYVVDTQNRRVQLFQVGETKTDSCP
jgi:tripartite motif-containing protein 71